MGFEPTTPTLANEEAPSLCIAAGKLRMRFLTPQFKEGFGLRC
jgi:hypothetical protein